MIYWHSYWHNYDTSMCHNFNSVGLGLKVLGLMILVSRCPGSQGFRCQDPGVQVTGSGSQGRES